MRIHKIKSGVLYTYLFIMLGIFPIVYKKGYSGMGTLKFQLFQYASAVCLGILLFLTAGTVLQKIIQEKSFCFVTRNVFLSVSDIGVICYFAAVLLSFLFSGYKECALWGADGWWMGVLPQTFFCLFYLYLSGNQNLDKRSLGIVFLSSTAVYVIAILHRFNFNPMGIRDGLSEQTKLQFLSTIGQSSWYSSFLCTVLPLGIYLFYYSSNKKTRLLAGLYTALGCMTLVTQNSDSAFFALGVVFLVLFYISFDDGEKMRRLCETLILTLASFKIIGILQIMLWERAEKLDFLSVWFSQGSVTGILLILLLVLYVLFFRREVKEWFWKRNHPGMKQSERQRVDCGKSQSPDKRIFYGCLTVLSITVVFLIVFIILNSNGFLLNRFGYRNDGNYVLFQDNWGNNRGFTWKFTCISYFNLAPLQKIFGVGPDCYKAYHYSIAQYADMLNDYWGNLNLTNAHNEYLTMLFNLGVVGVMSYLGMLAVSFLRFLKKRSVYPYAPAFALVIVSYMAHNFFCYQQVCCTPFLFLFMGMGECFLKQTEFNIDENRKIRSY